MGVYIHIISMYSPYTPISRYVVVKNVVSCMWFRYVVSYVAPAYVGLRVSGSPGLPLREAPAYTAAAIICL